MNGLVRHWQGQSLSLMKMFYQNKINKQWWWVMSLERLLAQQLTIVIHWMQKLLWMDPVWACVCVYICVSECLCVCALSQNDDRITTHSELCSGNSGPRQRMREQCNIFIRQEQAPLAKNEFVRLLDRPRCTDSAQAEPDWNTSEQEKKESRLIVPSSAPCMHLGQTAHKYLQ